MNDAATLLAVRGLRTHFHTDEGVVKAVEAVSFRICPAQTFALVGESGCGKSVTAFSMLRLLPIPPARIVSGRVEMDGRNLLELSEPQMSRVRGGDIAMIFQEPMTSLNPVFTCGNQIVEAIRLHRAVSAAEARRTAIEMLSKVGIPEPAQRFGEYPHQLSGGMRQRVMIAMALSCRPRLLIADEPTTALDVTIQAQILDLLRQIQAAGDLSIMLITHDLAVVAEMAQVVAVMYASKIVELTDVGPLFGAPLHPYTSGLFQSLPRLGQKRRRLVTIPGNVPNPPNFPAGCKFHPRCALTRRLAAEAAESETIAAGDGPSARVLRRCAAAEPPLREVRPGHWTACWQCPDNENAPQTDPGGGD